MSNYYPIIYVRGYAFSESEMIDTVATPYMGFNQGSTKIRQRWDRSITRHIFESPVVRLMKDYGYQDIYSDGAEWQGEMPKRPLIVCRYYESDWHQVSKDKKTVVREHIEDFAEGLETLIADIRNRYCQAHNTSPSSFKVYLVAHSMGGLICRCFLQNEKFRNSQERQAVDKVFTYGTPHNGIDVLGMNVPQWLRKNNMNNFNVSYMRNYLDIKSGPGSDANMLENKFPEDRFFSLIGTNSKDYDVALGFSRLGTGQMGDGLVRMENAFVKGAPRAHVHRSHSGHYGLVNSEEGYQSLTRFLFGDVRIDATLNVKQLPLPPDVQRLKDANFEVKGSYYFETSVAPRGARYYLDQRLTEHSSAIFREYDEMFPRESEASSRMPKLFSVFLDSSRVPKMLEAFDDSDARLEQSMVLTAEITIKNTEFEVNGKRYVDRTLPNRKLFSDQLILEVGFEKPDAKKLQVVGVKACWASEVSWEPGMGGLLKMNDDGEYVVAVIGKGERAFKGEIFLRIGGRAD